MTTYLCSTCGKTHRSDEPGCAQTFTIASPLAEDARPAYARAYFCPVCPRHHQPREGFSVVGYAEHQFDHFRDALLECAKDASVFRRTLETIERELWSPIVKDWPADLIRKGIGHHVAMALGKPSPFETLGAEPGAVVARKDEAR
jgi:hypothetical protein